MGAVVDLIRVFMIDTRGQRNLPQVWILSVIVKKHLVEIGQIERSPSICHKHPPGLNLLEVLLTAFEQKENPIKCLEDFDLKAKARSWP